MTSGLTSVLLPIALGVIMFGLGMTLTIADLLRIGQVRRAVAMALFCQLLVLPAVCLALVSLFDLPAQLAIGMMLLAASPGGVSANLFSYIFRGDVALNITLTAINSVLSVVSLPIIVNLSFSIWMPGDKALGLQFDKVAEVFAVVLIPVFVGIAVRRAFPAFAARMKRPMRIASTALLATLATGAIVLERANLSRYLGAVGLITALFCAISLTVGFGLSRVARIGHAQAVAVSMEVGIHNSTLAIAIAISPSLLASSEMAIPAAVYAIIQIGVATAFGLVISRRSSINPIARWQSSPADLDRRRPRYRRQLPSGGISLGQRGSVQQPLQKVPDHDEGE